MASVRDPVLLLTVVLLASAARADDWPQWLGPRRDSVWRETGLLDKFPEGGPKVVWRTPIGSGYSGPAVVGDRVYVMDYVTSDNIKRDNFARMRLDGEERVLCLDGESGKILWKHSYPRKYTISYPSGPRCTPTVVDGKVYALGAEGNLWCLSAQSGSVLWSKDFNKDYKADAARLAWLA